LTRRLRYWVLPAYAALTLLLTWPVAHNFFVAIPATRTAFDPPLQAFLIGWDWQAITTSPSRLFHPPIFHPEPRTLTYMDHMLGEAIVAGPVMAVTGSLAAGYNALFLLSFIASAWAVYRLTRLFAVPRFGAFLCGILFAFSPYRAANLDLLNQLQTQFLPLGLFFAIRYVRRWKMRDAVGALATLAVQVLFGWYYAYHLLVAYILLLVYVNATRQWRAPSGHPVTLFGLATVAALVVLPVVLPYHEQQRAMPEYRRTLGESALYSADVLDYVKSNERSILATASRLPTGHQSYWPGLVTVVLSAWILGEWIRARRRATPRAGATSDPTNPGSYVTGRPRFSSPLPRFPALLATTGFVLSLGPILHVAGTKIWIPLPNIALHLLIPGYSSLRAPARFAVVTLLGLVVLAGLGYRALSERLDHASTARVRRVALASIALLTGLSIWSHPIPLLPLPMPATQAEAYRWLASQPRDRPVVEIPVPAVDADESELHALRQFAVLNHGHPRVDGCSGFVSNRYKRFRTTVQSFPAPQSLEAMKQMGVSYVLVHYGDFRILDRASLESRIAEERRLVTRARFGDDVIYELKADGAEPQMAALSRGREGGPK
jgi:hypothetical protein